MEIWDAYLKDGSLAHQDLIRGQNIKEGLYHLVSEILVRHVDGSYLLMQRDSKKPNYPLMYETSCGGSALKNEDALTCAKRELYEETGIKSDNLSFIGQSIGPHTIYNNYLCLVDMDKNDIRLQELETIDYKWLNEKDFISFINSKEMIPSQKEHYSNYFIKMNYIKKGC